MVNINSKARRYVKICLVVIAVLLLVHLGFRLKSFIHIFFTHAGIALTQDEVLQAYKASVHDADRKPIVPRITHQIFHNWTHPGEEVLPLDWQASRQTCLNLNDGWEHMLWTTKSSKEFIEVEFPWFLPTYDNFQFPVQRIDALRYFLMRFYGGIYVDLDNGCKESLEPLRFYAAWTTDGGHGALSNNILGAEPNHPFWVMLTDNLISHAWNYPLPYLTISYATGQWFLTKIWEVYHEHLSPSAPVLTGVMMDGRAQGAPWVFFNHSRGGTWDNWDNRMFGWIGENLMLFTLLLTSIVAAAIAATWVLWRVARRLLNERKR